MAFNYSNLKAESNTFLQTNGKAMTHRMLREGAYDPVTDTPTTNVTSQAVSGVLLSVSDSDKGNLPDSVIMRAKKKICITDGGGLLPQPNDEIVVGSVTWKIVHVRTLNPNGDTIIYHACFCDIGTGV